VACGFTDAVSDTPEPTNPELETRVNKLDNEDDHTVKQVVFFSSKDD
jgi:hypothetical protein